MVNQTYDASDSALWKKRFEKKEEQWKDMRRTGKIFIPILGLLIISILYILFYVTFQTKWINLDPKTSEEFYLLTRQIIGLIFISIIVVGMGLVSAYKTSKGLISEFYEATETWDIKSLIRLKLFGMPPFPPPFNKIFKYPFITLKEPSDMPKTHWARWLGGPATLVIYDGLAVYIERGNQFSRVLGPGMPMPILERYERIKAIVDLRPQIRVADNLTGWTKDGIQVAFSIRAEIQIDCRKEAKERSVNLKNEKGAMNLRFPFDAEKVKIAVERIAVKYDGENLFETSWDVAAMGAVTGKLKGYISAHSIDELFYKGNLEIDDFLPEDETPLRISSFTVSKDLFNLINKALDVAGSQLLNLQVTSFIPVDLNVSEQIIKYWKANREKLDLIRRGETEAEQIRAKHRTQAEAYGLLLNTLADKFDALYKKTGEIDAASFTKTSIMFLTQALQESEMDPLTNSFIAKEALRNIKKLREELDL